MLYYKNMENEYENSRIERLKRGLYSPGGDGTSKEHGAELSPSDIELEKNWKDTTIIKDPSVLRTGPKVGVLKILVILSIVTVLLSGGYLVYKYFDPLANPSEKNISITFDVPPGATPGIPADIVVHVVNKNRVPLESAGLSIVYPSGTRSADSPDQDLRDEKKSFGTIRAGEAVNYRTKAIFLGEEKNEKEIKAVLEYRFAGMNSSFTKERTHSIEMLAAPINLTVEMLKEINAGQPLELSVTAFSNTVIPLRDVFVKVEYPLGFTFTSADPKPDFGSNIWRVGTLLPSEKFQLKIRGIFSGAEGEEKVFHTSAGVGSDKTARDIDTFYNKVLSALSLTRSFIGIDLLLNGKLAKDTTIPFGTRVDGKILWRNNLDTKIEQAQIEVRLSGVALNRPSINAGSGGFYRSSDNTIIWDSRGNRDLALLETGAQGTVSFSFQPLPPVSGNQALLNPTITAEITVRGRRIAETGVPEEVKSVIVENVRVSSQVQFASRAVYYVGPFVNSGPIPPRVEQETTYTVIWSIVNTSNSINNTEVRAVLPIYVEWYGSVSPGTENLTYNQNTNEVVWTAGNIPAGTGIDKPPREVAFQVVLTPSLSQLRSAPALVTQIRLSATDAFTGVLLEQNKSDITTDLSTDPKALRDTDLVVP
ncbi:MAG: hypothetical protein A2942_00720 [Candidatus Lloydbacteria bacterium RIFCSPLOWO2_01_FULL_50_20]|uniref:DUF11 domain-containing protein n=1 Tax=Candidatus Lloydbacteria bacterium RIFCSPLOWO2_01_FULL_50_20 TaxID=1798665 RepID=A0A1G2DDL4_9BACT|nr:MAG: hypothetical protein A2942_00720 [Candidatus Lloydbacteria bacterium RIFCSPLOWO2_01_FULL_50_20]